MVFDTGGRDPPADQHPPDRFEIIHLQGKGNALTGSAFYSGAGRVGNTYPGGLRQSELNEPIGPKVHR